MNIPPIGTPERRDLDLHMMSTPDDWPTWPRLPLKNPTQKLADGWPEHGYLINTSLEDDKVMPVVYLGTIFQPHNSDNFKEYESLEDIVDDGWTVD